MISCLHLNLNCSSFVAYRAFFIDSPAVCRRCQVNGKLKTVAAATFFGFPFGRYLYIERQSDYLKFSTQRACFSHKFSPQRVFV